MREPLKLGARKMLSAWSRNGLVAHRGLRAFISFRFGNRRFDMFAFILTIFKFILKLFIIGVCILVLLLVQWDAHSPY